MSGYMTVVNCAKCGEEFLPAPCNIFKKNDLQYCSWTCYNHRNDNKNVKKKIEVFYGVDTYNSVKPVMYKIIEDLKRKDVDVLRCSVRGRYFETANVKVSIIPEAKNIDGMYCDEAFGWFGNREIDYLRRYNETPQYEGTLIDYILEKEKSDE